jgi:hypothetical protein
VVAAVATVGAVAAAVVATAEVDMAAAATRQSPDHFCIGVLPVYFYVCLPKPPFLVVATVFS